MAARGEAARIGGRQRAFRFRAKASPGGRLLMRICRSAMKPLGPGTGSAIAPDYWCRLRRSRKAI
jgi:hypothetical protein